MGKIQVHQVEEVKQRKKSETGKCNKSAAMVVIATIIGIAALFTVLQSCKNQSGNPDKTSNGEIASLSTSSENSTEESSTYGVWEKVSIDGTPAIQIKFKNPDAGTIEMSYSAVWGFRFGYYDANNTIVPLKETDVISAYFLCTQEMVDNGHCLKESIGEEVMFPISYKISNEEGFQGNGQYKNDYFYLAPGSDEYALFVKYINEGLVTGIEINDIDITPEETMNHPVIKWEIQCEANEFEKAKSQL